MNITAENYLSLVDSETKTISDIIKSSIHNGWVMTTHCLVVYFDSKAMLTNTLRVIKESNLLNHEQLLDDGSIFVSKLERIEERTNTLYLGINPKLFFCRFLLKKTTKHYDAIIKAIVEHDAGVLGIPDTELPIDELMTELNKPKNKAMLEKSIAELNAGNFSAHKLIHD